MQKLHRLPPVQLGGLADQFQDPRLPELLFRYRARNFPDTLNAEEQQRWTRFCQQRLSGASRGPGPNYRDFQDLLKALPEMAPALKLELQDYAATLAQRFGLSGL